MTSPIFTFFPKKNKNNSANSFYEQNLPKASKSVPENESNQLTVVKESLKKLQDQNIQLKTENFQLKAEIDKLQKENTKKQNDLKNLLKLHKETCRMYVNKEMKFKILKKSVNLQSQVLYESFESHFGEKVLKQLRKLQGGKNRDSTFILTCMRKLCEDIDLKSITSKGTQKDKSAFPLQKREILESIFLERLASIKLTDKEQNERYILLNRHINVAIFNIKNATVSFLVYISYLMC